MIRPDELLTVLVVDDIDASRTQLVDLVTDIGHHCLQSANGREALQCIDAVKVDIVLLDLLMPDVDGFEITRQIRQRITGKWLPVIVLSSLEGEEHFIHALSVGAADCLVKPVRPAILRAKLRHYQRVLSLQTRTAMLAQRQMAINETIADAIITIDSGANVCELNRSARQLFEPCIAGELIGRPIEDLIGIGMTELAGTHEYVHHPKGLAPVPFALTCSDWSLGVQSYCTIGLRDLSESRRVERMKDEFLATVSHELRTPLTSILGAIGLMVAGAAGALPPAALELATVAQRNGTRLSRLIDDLLDLTKLEGNRMTLNMREASLNGLLNEAIAANAGYAQRLGVQLQFQPSPEPSQAVVDADRLLQVLANLLSNAIKHSPTGASVELRLVADPVGWRIDVADRGPGIDPKFRARMFEKFSQADGSDQRSVAGTGLGLYISRMLVERMGGSVSASSVAGQGSVFSIVLPRPPTGRHSRWVLCIARDRQELDRLAHWITELAPVELVADMAAAQAWVQHAGMPAAVVADPQSQGLADEFCKSLQALAAADHILLVGDSLDEQFARSHGLCWMPLRDTSPETFKHQLQRVLNPAPSGVRHG